MKSYPCKHCGAAAGTTVDDGKSLVLGGALVTNRIAFNCCTCGRKVFWVPQKHASKPIQFQRGTQPK